MQRIVDLADQALSKYLSEKQSLPPIHLWKPEHVIENDMQIDSNGNWFHEGGEIKRLELCQLFASILRKENEKYFLITPREKFPINVEDVPFVMVSVSQINYHGSDCLLFIDNLNQSLVLQTQDQFELRSYQGVTVPYIKVRDELYARVSRACFYQLVESFSQFKVIDEQQHCFINSANQQFSIGTV